MEFHTVQAVKWRNLLDCLAPTLVDGNLVFGPNGITIHGVTEVLWVVVKLDNIDKYVFNEENEIPIGVNFGLLYKCFSSVKENDRISMFLTKAGLYGQDSVGPYLEWKIEGSCIRTDGRLNLINIETVVAEIPFHQYQSILEVDSGILQAVVRNHQNHGTQTQILSYCDEKTGTAALVFRTTGDMSVVMTSICAKEDDAVDHPKQTTDKREIYRIRYLLSALKAANLSPYVTMMLEPNFPLVLRWQVGDMGTIQFSIAALTESSTFSVDQIDFSQNPIPQKGQIREVVEPKPEPVRKRIKRKASVLAHPTTKKKCPTKDKDG